MSRKRLIRTNQYPYHITSRSNNKEWFYIPIEDVWVYFQKHLKWGCSKFNVHIHAFVLMSNHYHMLLETPEANLDQFMRFFNQSLGKSIAHQADRINRIFGAPYKWSLIQKDQYYGNVYRYIYQNPLRAGLVNYFEDYQYSSLYQKKLSPLISRQSIRIENPIDYEWLNSQPGELVNSSIKRGLKRFEFEPGKNEKQWQRKILDLRDNP